MHSFDPGWKGEQAKGPEDRGIADLGNDPLGILDRYAAAAFIIDYIDYSEFGENTIGILDRYATAASMVGCSSFGQSTMGVMDRYYLVC